MAKTFPGRLMHDYEPSLTDRGNAYVGLADVGYCEIEFTACVNTGVTQIVVHSLRATPTWWNIRPYAVTATPFIAWEVSAADSSAVRYWAAFPTALFTFHAAQAVRSKLIAFR